MDLASFPRPVREFPYSRDSKQNPYPRDMYRFRPPQSVRLIVLIISLRSPLWLPDLQDDHAFSQVRKSCTARKDSVRRNAALLSPLVPSRMHLYNGYFLFMSYFPQSHFSRQLAKMLLLALLCTVGAHAQERADCRAFRSALLHSPVHYCVYLPASYSAPEAKTRKYPVLYLLHGLGGNEQAAALDGEWNDLQDLRSAHKVGDFLVVAPDGWDTFYIDSRDPKTPYGEFFLREFL